MEEREGAHNLIPLLALLLYSNALQGAFVWDDRAAIVSSFEETVSTANHTVIYFRLPIEMSAEKLHYMNYFIMIFGDKIFI
jgi:hypothetical protein